MLLYGERECVCLCEYTRVAKSNVCMYVCMYVCEYMRASKSQILYTYYI
jgi:hypothetical protein